MVAKMMAEICDVQQKDWAKLVMLKATANVKRAQG